MGRSLSVCRGGLSVAAAVVLLTACTGSDGDDAASSESSASSSSAESSASRTGSGFCTQAAVALQQVEPAFSGQGDPASQAPALHEAAEEVRAIDAPPEISEDWIALADGIEQFSQAFADVDVNDPASASAFRQRTTEIVGELTTSATNVETYLAEECGIGPTATTPAAPSS